MPVYLQEGQETREGLEAVRIVRVCRRACLKQRGRQGLIPVLTSDFHIYDVLLEGLQTYPLPSQIHKYLKLVKTCSQCYGTEDWLYKTGNTHIKHY